MDAYLSSAEPALVERASVEVELGESFGGIHRTPSSVARLSHHHVGGREREATSREVAVIFTQVKRDGHQYGDGLRGGKSATAGG